MSDDYRTRLIAARRRLGLEPADMAERLLTPRQTYAQWEAGTRRTPGVAVVAAEGMLPAIDWQAELAGALVAGETPHALARRLGVRRNQVAEAEERHGLHLARMTRTRNRGIDWDAEIAAGVAEGETATVIARRLAVDPSSVVSAARTRGVRLAGMRV